MKQKTAMQELLESLEGIHKTNHDNDYKKGYLSALGFCKLQANGLLEKEKEQIIDAFIEGIDELGTIYNAGDYYNSKYKQDEQ